MDFGALKSALAERSPRLMDSRSEFAVLVPIIERDGEIYLLYEVRSANLRRQPGEICFPGGRLEQGETPLEAALRETEEELGIPASQIEVLGKLDFIAHRGGFLIHPILAKLSPEALDFLTENPTEVAEIFLVPLNHLKNHPELMGECTLTPQPQGDFPYGDLGVPEDYNWRPGREIVPAYHWQEKIIWGLTARITRNFLSLLSSAEGRGRAGEEF